ncbi:MAG TPA: xylosidase/arabinosidase, partial [Pirellulales bacterium]
WRAIYHGFDAFVPWNIGNYYKDREGIKHAATDQWAKDIAECREHGVVWIPVVYPGFRWDNLKQQPTGSGELPRRGGDFLWEQLQAAAELKCDTVYVAMFDEVDEGTAVFKISNTPPTQAKFLDLEGKPSDWYLRLLGEGGKMLRGERAISKTIPITP